ncbi:MAG TPA: DUF2242 domain-containing protein [Burkholderiales bacterium]|nr:DUF2242 domain-containing protein [Burkholderiales bacterium]
MFAVMLAIAGCSSSTEVYRKETFEADTPHSQKIAGSGKVVCWSVKRALLSQGYMLDRSADAVTLTGTKEFQTDDDTDVTLRLQTSCADNNNGSSTVFVTAIREVSKVQNVKQSVTAGVSIATITLPSGSQKVMNVISRETIRDPDFYKRFYSLVKGYAAQEAGSSSPGDK